MSTPRDDTKRRGGNKSAYLLDPEGGWLNSQVSDTQAVNFYEAQTSRKKEKAYSDYDENASGLLKLDETCVGESDVVDLEVGKRQEPSDAFCHRIGKCCDHVDSLEKDVARLHQKLDQVLLQNGQLLSFQRILLEIIQNPSAHAISTTASDMAAEADIEAEHGHQPSDASGWTLDSQENSQVLKRRKTEAHKHQSLDAEPRIPSLESQLFRVITKGYKE
ncbi:hypothetical protein BDN72DRAFT_958825 [Pluteus cervinus]|uniref:Uncharacterized protein n=1 Tax=Pluteus cervinus TaxID=181527 RepID=A0ACD3AXX2_9AGAR|nr:hypothetical protein BDN72DRAFT_958825 [Pluteus cervinus]